MSAEKLREAAKALRERAEAATGDEWEHFPDGLVWRTDDVPGDPTCAAAQVEDAAYIATMHPGVGLALADWLDDVAAGWVWDEDGEGGVWDDGMPMALSQSLDWHAARIADLILGGAS